MFGKKKAPRKAATRIVLLDAVGAELFACPTGDFALPEPVVLALSMEYFNDPEPCTIHRGAVHRRAMMELLEHCAVGRAIPLSALDEGQRKYFPDGTAAICIEEVVG